MPKLQQSIYHLQDSASGLYVLLGETRPSLTAQHKATRFTTADAALTVASRHMPQDPLDLVRVDA